MVSHCNYTLEEACGMMLISSVIFKGESALPDPYVYYATCHPKTQGFHPQAPECYYWPDVTEEDCFLLPSPLFLLTTECAE